MASISFPSDRPQFYASSFEANSSFQGNPPRNSDYDNGELFSETDGTTEKAAAEDVELDEQEDKVKQLEKRIRKEDVWNEMFLTSNGRDKAFKLMQYTIRVCLLVHSTVRSRRLSPGHDRPPWDVGLVKRLDSTANGLSLTRKLLLLFNWLSPLTTITAQQSVPFSADHSSSKRPFLHALLHTRPAVLLEFVHALADDAVTYYKLGLFGKKFGQRAERFSDWCWLLATLVGLAENYVERQMIGQLQSEVENRLYAESMTGATAKSNPRAAKSDEMELKRLQRQDYWLRVTTAKLVMDLIFVSYELLNIKGGGEAVKTLTGVTAAMLSSAKLYDRHKTLLLKKMLTS